MHGLKDPVISVHNFSKKYKDVFAVNNLSFSVFQGEVYGLIGPNGAGKTTTLNCLLGLIPESSGTLQLFGSSLFSLDDPAKLVGVVRDPIGLEEKLSAKRVLSIAAIASGTSKSRVEEVIKQCGIDGFLKRRVDKLSTGQKQRLSIAVALLPNPKLLICDEPQNGLDAEGVIWFRKLIRNHADKGGSVLLATHFLSEMEKMADCLTILSTEVRFQGSVEELTYDKTVSLEDRYMQITGQEV